MADRAFTQEEVERVVLRYPRLKRSGFGTVDGVLDMRAEYDGDLVVDRFQIRIDASNRHSDRLPAVSEIGGRTQAIAQAHKIRDLRDLHCNPDGTACVCVKQMENTKFPPGLDLLVFVEDLAVPYLFGLVHYERHGRWPWGEYSHGALGLLEFCGESGVQSSMEDVRDILATIRREVNWKEYHKQLRRPSGERLCLCGSRRQFGKCHARAWRGLQVFCTELKNHGLNARGLVHIT